MIFFKKIKDLDNLTDNDREKLVGEHILQRRRIWFQFILIFIIGALFTYFANQKLENYKINKEKELYLLQQKITAFQQVLSLFHDLTVRYIMSKNTVNNLELDENQKDEIIKSFDNNINDVNAFISKNQIYFTEKNLYNEMASLSNLFEGLLQTKLEDWHKYEKLLTRMESRISLIFLEYELNNSGIFSGNQILEFNYPDKNFDSCYGAGEACKDYLEKTYELFNKFDTK